MLLMRLALARGHLCNEVGSTDLGPPLSNLVEYFSGGGWVNFLHLKSQMPKKKRIMIVIFKMFGLPCSLDASKGRTSTSMWIWCSVMCAHA